MVGTAPETTDENVAATIDVDLGGQFYVARAALPALAAGDVEALSLIASELWLVGTRFRGGSTGAGPAGSPRRDSVVRAVIGRSARVG